MNVAVVFDLDGTLVDSEALSQAAWDETLRLYGGRLRPDDWPLLEGHGFPAAHELLAARVALPSADVVWDVYLERLLRRLPRELRTFPDARLTIDALYARNVPLGLASSSRRARAEPSLASSGLERRFAAAVYGDDVTRAKPAPDTYLRAAALLGTHPSRCVAVEDSPVGVMAARSAGMAVVAVRRHGRRDLTAADVVVDALTPGAVLGLAGVVAGDELSPARAAARRSGRRVRSDRPHSGFR